jgi:hypothetical protein
MTTVVHYATGVSSGSYHVATSGNERTRGRDTTSQADTRTGTTPIARVRWRRSAAHSRFELISELSLAVLCLPKTLA